MSAFVDPESRTVDVGKEATFRCRILTSSSSSSSLAASPSSLSSSSDHQQPSITWLKEDSPLKVGGRISLLGREVLRIDPVHRSDRGVYQCLVKTEREAIRASALLKIGGSSPFFLFLPFPLECFLTLPCPALPPCGLWSALGVGLRSRPSNRLSG